MSDLFVSGPVKRQWRESADPLVWNAMRDHLDGIPVPESIEDVQQALVDAFERIALLPLPRLASEGSGLIRRYSFPYGHKDPSDVPIDVASWAQILIPLLVTRARPARRMAA